MALTRRQWIDEFAAAAGVASPTEPEVEQLLALAGVAAHSSERTAAPVTCWIAARASLPLADAVAMAERLSESMEDTTGPEGN